MLAFLVVLREAQTSLKQRGCFSSLRSQLKPRPRTSSVQRPPLATFRGVRVLTAQRDPNRMMMNDVQ